MIITGIDTETYNGYVKLLAISKYDTEIKREIAHFTIEDSDTENLIMFMLAHCDGAYNMFYNIGFDISAILKPYLISDLDNLRTVFYDYIRNMHEYNYLKEKEILDSNDAKRLVFLEQELDDRKPMKYKIGKFLVTVINGKSFSVRYKYYKQVYFFDIANFYKTAHDGFMSLDNAAMHFLGIGKNNKELGIDREKIGNVEGYYEEHREDIIKYCIQDALLTAMLTAHTIKSYNNIGINFPAKPYSKASVSKQYLKDHYGAKYERSQLAYKRADRIIKMKKYYHGGYIRTYAVGFYKNVRIRDIRSAYPYAISKLYSLNNTVLVTDKDKEFEQSDYKLYVIEIRHVPELQTKIRNQIYFLDDNETQLYYLTEYDKKILDLYGYEYNVIKAYGFITEKILMFPGFDKLYTEKNAVKKMYGGESAEYTNIKIVMNGFYGVLAQSKPAETDFTNYLYAAYITSMCRYMILSDAKEISLKQKVLQVSTDSVMYEVLDETVTYPVTDELGGFDEESYDYVIIYGSGIYVFSKDNKIGERKRGFNKIKLSDLSEITDSFVSIINTRPVHISESLIQEIPELLATWKREIKIFSPVKALKKSYRTDKIITWNILDFSFQKADLSCYRINELFK